MYHCLLYLICTSGFPLSMFCTLTRTDYALMSSLASSVYRVHIMWFFSFYSLVTSCFACHLYISCKSCTCLSLCKLGHLLSSCLGHWFCMLFKLGSCISKRVRLVGEKESILVTISSLPDARLRDNLVAAVGYSTLRWWNCACVRRTDSCFANDYEVWEEL